MLSCLSDTQFLWYRILQITGEAARGGTCPAHKTTSIQKRMLCFMYHVLNQAHQAVWSPVGLVQAAGTSTIHIAQLITEADEKRKKALYA